MKEVSAEAESGGSSAPENTPENGRGVVKSVGGGEGYNGYQVMQQNKPSRLEVMGWYLYEFCSYFVITVLIPVVFPLIISQLQQLPSDPLHDWVSGHPTLTCADNEIRLYVHSSFSHTHLAFFFKSVVFI